MDEKYEMVVKVSDGFCAYEYTFLHSGHLCIEDFAAAIEETLDVERASEPEMVDSLFSDGE